MIDTLKGFKDYLMNQKFVSQNTLQSYLRDVETYIAFLLTIAVEDPLKAVEANVEMFIGHLEAVGRCPATVARHIASIRCYYQYLLLSGAVQENPARRIKIEKTEKKVPSILSGKEIELLLAQPNVMGVKGCRDKAMMELLYATGIRVSELIDLNIDDIDLVTGVLYCKSSKSDRAIPIYSTAVSAICDYTSRVRHSMINCDEAGQALFVNLNGHRLTRQGFWKIIKSYAGQAKITKEITPHTLRHSFALHLLENGAQLKDIQEMLGHADISSTQVYAHMLDNHFKEVYNNCHPKARRG